MAKIIGIEGATGIPPTSADVAAAAAVMPEDIRKVLLADDGTATQVNLRLAPASLEERAELVERLDAQVRERVEQYAHINDAVLGRKGPGRRANVEKYLMVERDTVQQSLEVLMTVDHSDADAMRLALQHVGSTLHLLGTQPLAASVKVAGGKARNHGDAASSARWNHGSAASTSNVRES